MIRGDGSLVLGEGALANVVQDAAAVTGIRCGAWANTTTTTHWCDGGIGALFGLGAFADKLVFGDGVVLLAGERLGLR